jgi:hypothetical protein
MTFLLPDIIAKVSLYNRIVSGFGGSITPREMRLNLVYEGKFYDCSILLQQVGITLNLGETAEVPIRMVSPRAGKIKSEMSPGSRFELWRGGYIGKGEVIRIVTPGEQIGAIVNIQITTEIFGGSIIKAGEDEGRHLVSVLELGQPVSYHGVIYKYIFTQSIRKDYWPQKNRPVPFYRGRYRIRLLGITEDGATSDEVLKTDHFINNNSYFLGDSVIGEVELHHASQLIGLPAKVEILEIDCEGTIIREGKNRDNRLTAVVRLKKAITYKGSDYRYVITRNNQSDYWPESITFKENISNISFLTEEDAQSDEILEKDDFSAGFLQGTIRLSDE